MNYDLIGLLEIAVGVGVFSIVFMVGRHALKHADDVIQTKRFK